jgi:hypothetical protein
MFPVVLSTNRATLGVVAVVAGRRPQRRFVLLPGEGEVQKNLARIRMISTTAWAAVVVKKSFTETTHLCLFGFAAICYGMRSTERLPHQRMEDLWPTARAVAP